MEEGVDLLDDSEAHSGMALQEQREIIGALRGNRPIDVTELVDQYVQQQPLLLGLLAQQLKDHLEHNVLEVDDRVPRSFLQKTTKYSEYNIYDKEAQWRRQTDLEDVHILGIALLELVLKDPSNEVVTRRRGMGHVLQMEGPMESMMLMRSCQGNRG